MKLSAKTPLPALVPQAARFADIEFLASLRLKRKKTLSPWHKKSLPIDSR
jgi:hypothetical protein